MQIRTLMVETLWQRSSSRFLVFLYDLGMNVSKEY